MIFAIRKKRALTFIELIIVIAIIGVLSITAVPKFKTTFDNLELESFVKDIYYLSRYLQASAVNKRQIYYLSIDKEKGEFQARLKPDAGTEDEFKNIEGRFGRIYKLPQKVNISVDPPEKAGIYFYPDSSIEGIKITFENEQKKDICLIIKGVTGDIQIQ